VTRAWRAFWRPASTGAVLLLALAAPAGAQQAADSLVRAPFPVRFAFAGDINLGTRTLPDGLPPDSGFTFFDGARPFLAGDLVIGNFEGVLADSGESPKCWPPAAASDSSAADTALRPPRRKHRQPADSAAHKNCYAFATPSWLAPRLAAAGFTHLNLANNHANDYGVEWREHTEQVLDSLGLHPYGPLGRIAIDTVVHGDSATIVGLIGFTTYAHSYDLLDVRRSVAVVDSIRPLVDLLVVTFHGGREGATAVRTGRGPEYLGREPRGDLRRWARAVLDAGADAVVGHGPHVLRGVEFYRGRPIVYSLGNFATWRGFNLEGPLALTTVLELVLDGQGGFLSARMPPLVQVPQQGPRYDPAEGALALLRRITRLDFPATGARFLDDGSLVAPVLPVR
jgi:hypothetical protein